MANEAGDMKILGNFRRLIDIVAADAVYRPSNEWLSVANLETKLTAASASVADIGVKLAPNKLAIDARQTAYTEAVALVRGARNILKASGATVETIADADTFTRKIFGLRKSKKAVDDPNTATNEAEKSHSASQLSYDAVLGNFRRFVEILNLETLYRPNETQFQTANLVTIGNALETHNNAVSSSFVPLTNARALRDKLLYTDEDCLCNLAQMVKTYIKAIHGTRSQIFKSVSALPFPRGSR